ncbi:MAG: hypothetical protein LBH00_10900 [Planctomycetaceae bacterium]|nr:hypothetical protein [Planctomycetaceae bacterium]
MASTSSSQPVTYRAVPFNFVDLEAKATAYLAQVKEEALRLAAAAQAEVLKIRQETAAEKEKNQAELEAAKNQARIETETIRKQLDELHGKLKLEEENFQKRKEQLEKDTAALKIKQQQESEESREKGFEEGKKAGYDEGHSKGYADGEMKAQIDYAEKVHHEAEIQLGAKLETLLPALSGMIDQLETAKRSFLQYWEEHVIRIAAAIAEKAVNRQLPEMIDVPIKLLRETLELGTGSTSLRIRLNSGDYETLKPQIDILVREMTRSVPVEMIADPSVAAGGCVAETSKGSIDNQIFSRIERIEQELLTFP